MKYAFYGLIVISLGFLGFQFLGSNNSGNFSPKEANVSSAIQDSQAPAPETSGQTLKFSASITNRNYSPKQIDVPFGATVELTVKNNDNEQHGLFIQDFGVQDVVAPLQTKTVRFVANRKGESTTFCSVSHPEKLIINVN